MNIIELDFALLIAIIALISSIIWNLYNTYINHKNSKRWKIGSRYYAKKQALKYLYDYTKDFAERMEITDEVKKEDFTVFHYNLKKKHGDGYEEPYKIKFMVKEILDSCRYTMKICGYPVNDKEKDTEERQKTLFIKEQKIHIVKQVFGAGEITIPNEMLPKTPEEIKKVFLNTVINLAKGVGLKEKDLK